jgi:S-adenosylmethionine:tRNA ribosyltransferase-isomerase
LLSIEHIHLSEFNYFLPDDRIALFPANVRDQSRLLIRDSNGNIKDEIFSSLPDHLPPNSRMVFNNSKVIPARLLFTKDTGSHIEIFCLRPVNPGDYSLSLSSTHSCIWECMIGNIRKFKSGTVEMPVVKDGEKIILKAHKISASDNYALIRFEWDDPMLSFAGILQLAGQTPLPPYIKRPPVDDDKLRYQTVYSSQEGSVAAPTAGLHFTPEVLGRLRAKNIVCDEVTLHVGAGTFQPVKTELIRDHQMHAEYYEVTHQFVDMISNNLGEVICVGTTSVRTLESLYWTGVKLLTTCQKPEIPELEQWEAYFLPQDISIRDSFQALKKWVGNKHGGRGYASTSLMIVPGYRFRMTKALITNFHQPGSTLLMLIAAFIGDTWKETYQYALDKGFRFLSYGDSSLLFRPENGSE